MADHYITMLQPTSDEAGISPALNISLSSVLFTTAQEKGQGKPENFTLTKNLYTSPVWNLTIQDGTNFAAERKSGEPANVLSGDTVTVNITNLPSDNVNAYTQISAMLTDSKGKAAAYGKISDKIETGEAAFKVPEGLEEGQYKLQVFGECVKSRDGLTPTDYASNMAALDITVGKSTFAISASETELDFGKKTLGYTSLPKEKEITITNIGNRAVKLEQPKALNYTIGSLSSTDIAPNGGTATFTIQPKTGLIAGTYSETITVYTESNAEAKINVTFAVNGGISAEITGDTDIFKGSSANLKAAAAGGTGDYSYQWSGGGITDTTPSVTVSPEETTTYTVDVTDQGGGSAQATITVNVKVPAITYISIKTPPGKITYQAGETFDPAGLELTVGYENNTATDVTYGDSTKDKFTFTPDLATPLTSGDRNITVGYGGKTAEQPVTVQDVPDVPDIPGQVNTVTSSLTPGTYHSPQDAELSTGTEGAAIYYTTDGSEPDRNSTLYKEPIRIEKSLTIKAMAVKDKMTDSVTASFEYIIMQEYEIEEGAGSTHYIGSGKNLVFRCSGELEKLRKILIDGAEAAEENYSLESGSTVLTLKSKYLDTLGVGEHTLRMEYEDGKAEAVFHVKKQEGQKTPTDPKKPAKTTTTTKETKEAKTARTGDDTPILPYLALAAGSIAVTLYLAVKKRRRRMK